MCVSLKKIGHLITDYYPVDVQISVKKTTVRSNKGVQTPTPKP